MNLSMLSVDTTTCGRRFNNYTTYIEIKTFTYSSNLLLVPWLWTLTPRKYTSIFQEELQKLNLYCLDTIRPPHGAHTRK